MTSFTIIEQHDGRYICVALYNETTLTTRKGETLIGYEEECRSTLKCYEEINEYVVASGMYLDGPVTIHHIQYKPEA